MSRISDGAVRASLIALMSAAALFSTACEQIEGRNSIREGNRMFREMQFVDAAAAYERAIKQVPDPIVHYNLGLAYSKMYRAGSDRPVLIGEMGDPVCGDIPGLQQTGAEVCIKRPQAQDQSDRRRFNSCSQDDVCPSSFECKKTTMCSASSAQLADLAAQHMLVWIKAQPTDADLAARLKTVRDEMKAKQEEHEKRLAAIPESSGEARAAEIQRIKSVMDELTKRVDQLTLKDDMRVLITQAWMETDQYDKALAFWESELAAKPNDTAIMGRLAGIHLKANDWRKAIAWYHKVSQAETEPAAKVAALVSIGNVGWGKLNSKVLNIDDSIELADYAIGALQEGTQIQPKNGRLYALMASILNFKSLTHGVSWAAAIERAHAQDLLKLSRVLIDEAKRQQQQQQNPAPAAPAPAAPAPAAPAPAAGSASPSPSGAPATPTTPATTTGG